MNNDFKHKYLKYKIKYNNLKKGGGENDNYIFLIHNKDSIEKKIFENNIDKNIQTFTTGNYSNNYCIKYKPYYGSNELPYLDIIIYNNGKQIKFTLKMFPPKAFNEDKTYDRTKKVTSDKFIKHYSITELITHLNADYGISIEISEYKMYYIKKKNISKNTIIEFLGKIKEENKNLRINL